MIFYFTATGNSLDVAQTIAHETGDALIDLGHAYRAGAFRYPVEQGDTLGFVFPVYAGTTPGIVDDFVRQVRFAAGNGNPFVPGYCFCVFTCGAAAGKSADFFAKMLERYQHIHLDASFSVHTVGNCVYLYNMPTPEKQQQILSAAHMQARRVAHFVDSRRMEHLETRNPIWSAMSLVTGHENKKHSVKPFHVDLTTCTGCGICARVCPTGTIHMEKGLPVWSGESCTQCLACLHRCPTQASQYGSGTAKRRRYLNPVMENAPLYSYADTAEAVEVDFAVEEPAPEVVQAVVSNKPSAEAAQTAEESAPEPKATEETQTPAEAETDQAPEPEAAQESHMAAAAESTKAPAAETTDAPDDAQESPQDDSEKQS